MPPKPPRSENRPRAARILHSTAAAASRAPSRIPQSRWWAITRRVRSARDAGNTSMTVAARHWTRDAALWLERNLMPEQSSAKPLPGVLAGGESVAAAPPRRPFLVLLVAIPMPIIVLEL